MFHDGKVLVFCSPCSSMYPLCPALCLTCKLCLMHIHSFCIKTILFITMLVLFHCKGIQQKSLKHSWPQNMVCFTQLWIMMNHESWITGCTLALPWWAPPLPHLQESGGWGTAYQKKASSQGATVGTPEKGKAFLGGAYLFIPWCIQDFNFKEADICDPTDKTFSKPK